MPAFLSHHRRSVGLVLTLAVSMALIQGGRAQLSGQNAARTPDETIEIEAGDVFEILAKSDDPTAEAVWVLTQDRTFIEATRNAVFRTRQIQPGEYLLDGTIREPMLDRDIRRIFLLRIVPHVPKDPTNTPPQTGEIVSTMPRSEQGVITLPENFHVVRFTPDPAITAHFAVVLDAAAAQASPDNIDTYSYSEASPLFVWFAEPRDRTMELAIQRKDGSVSRTQVKLKIGEPENLISSQGIIASARSDGSVKFALQAPPLPGVQAIALWDFGDGTQSLLLSPAHKYARNGTFTIRVSVRDIMNGNILGGAQTTINVTGIDETGSGATTVSSSSSSAQNSAQSSSSSAPATGGSSDGFFATLWDRLNSAFVRTILIVVGIIVILGLLVLVATRLLRRSRLDKTLEDAESLLLKKNAVQSVIDAPAAPLQVKRAPKTEEVAPEVLDTEDHPVVRETPPISTEPHIDESAAPSWLKKGLTGSSTPVAEEPAPAPEPIQEPVPEPAPEPVVEPPVAEPAVEEVSTPSWMMPPEETPAPPTIEESAPPVAEPAPTVATEPTPVIEPVVAPEPIVEPVPQPESVVSPEPIAPATPAPTPARPKDDARAEREREKRRLKRQRYRQNLKKREQEKKAAAPVSTPAETEPSVSIQTPVSAPIDAPVPSPVLPPENFAEELPAAQPEHELPAAKAASELPAPAPAAELPSAPSLSEPPATPTNSDEDVKFIIRADNVGDDQNA